jgi:hypothetical protein
MRKLYATDFHLWAKETAQLLRERRFEDIDLEALIEEVEGLARADEHAMESQMERLIEHLLKLGYASGRLLEDNERGWTLSVVNARLKIAQRMKRVPSLQRYPEIILSDAYEVGRNEAGRAVDLELLPVECPWSVTELLGADFFPHSDEA